MGALLRGWARLDSFIGAAHTELNGGTMFGDLKAARQCAERRGVGEARLFVEIPSERADFSEVFEFSHTYDGYGIHGGPVQISRFCHPVSESWAAGESLESFDLDVLRAALFLAHRGWRHAGEWPEDESEYRLERAIVEAIRAKSGGFVDDHRPISL